MPPTAPRTEDLPSIEDLSVDDVDRMISKQFCELSVEERDQVLEEIHGVAAIPEEKEEKSVAGLKEVSAWIEELAEPGSAYMTARTMDAEYVSSPRFVIPFLRASRFNAREAAQRILVHFYYKKLLFGTLKLVRDIIPSDVSRDDWMNVNDGYMRKLSNVDRSGRSVFAERLTDYPDLSWKQILRPMWCEAMSVAMETNVQQRGVVGLTFCSCGDELIMDSSLIRHASAIEYAIPYRLMAYHVVVQNPKLHNYFQKIRYFMSPESRLRFRFHLGSDIENLRSLRSFGLPLASYDIPCTTEVRLVQESSECHFMSVYSDIVGRKRKLLASTTSRSHSSNSFGAVTEKETGTGKSNDGHSSTSSSDSLSDLSIRTQPNGFQASQGAHGVPTTSDIVSSFTAADVLSGRGQSRKHPGNARMHELVSDFRLNYHHASKLGKTEIARSVVQTIVEEGGRFLKRADDDFKVEASLRGKWIKLDDASARERVSKVFRRHKLKGNEKQVFLT